MLKIRNVSKFYSGKTALNNISLDVEKGRVFGLLGPNGAGKTSLIRIITLITAPDHGEVFLNNERISSKHIGQIGYLPEERGLYRKMTIMDQALYFARLKGMSHSEARKTINDWFEKLEMSGWKNKRADELSKGMQQKVQFVISVLHRPQLIILDEPFTGFDPINAAIIKKEILELKKAGTTIILSTHRMESVEELCDDIGLINNAELMIEGEVHEVRSRYKKAQYSVTYTGELPVLDDAESLSNIQLNGYRQVVLQMKESQTSNSLLARLIDQVTIHEFKEIVPSVNDIFIQLVEGGKNE